MKSKHVASMLLVVALGACGGNGGSTGGSGSTPTTTPAAKNAVDIKIFSFRPSALSIGVGETVTWTQQDNTIHTVTAGTPAAPAAAQFDSGDLGQAKTFTHTFAAAGTFPYFCQKHTSMVGEITVA